MLAARLSWVGPSFLSTIRQETPCRFSSAAMNRPAGPAPTTNTWVSVAIRYLTDNSHRDAFRGTDLREYLAVSRASLRLDVGRPDHPGPLLGFVGDELAEVAGRAWNLSATKAGKARLHLGVGEGGVDFAIELVDVFSWRISWCCDAI